MNGIMRWIGMAVVVVLTMGMTIVSAQTVNSPTKPAPPGPVQPPPPGKQSPFLYVAQYGARPVFEKSVLPFDFQFAAEVTGGSFKPGERVTITADHVSVPAQTATADQFGSFAVNVRFSWIFCGPAATTQPAPVFHAVGNDGSSASASPYAPSCPYLLALPVITLVTNPDGPQEPPPPVTPTGGVATGSGSTGSGTVQPGIPPPLSDSSPSLNPPAPVPVTLNVQGFGFHALEAVSVQVSDADGKPQGDPVHVAADKQGRVETQVQTVMPALCSANDGLPKITASGDKGTSMTARLIWFMPLVACPVREGPGQPDTPPADNPPAPVPPTAVSPGDVATNAAAQAAELSISLPSVTVRRGHVVHATIGADAAGTFAVTVKYRGGHLLQRSVQASAPGPLSVSWRVPKSVKAGKALLTVTSATSKATIQATFLVK